MEDLRKQTPEGEPTEQPAPTAPTAPTEQADQTPEAPTPPAPRRIVTRTRAKALPRYP